MPSKKAIIIGAGIAGIAASIRLAVKGFKVEVFEANSYPGGKLSEFEQQGYRFDAGPSLFTMPQYVDELFVLAGKNPRDYFNYQKLDPVCHYFYEDGTRFGAFADEESLAAEIERTMGEPAEKLKAHARNSSRIYNITNPRFFRTITTPLKNLSQPAHF